LKRWWRVNPVVQNLESNLHLCHHLVPYGILLHGVPVFVVDLNAVSKGLRYFDTEFIRAFMIALIHRRCNDSVKMANFVRTHQEAKAGSVPIPFASMA
jgi:hypothetical protein